LSCPAGQPARVTRGGGGSGNAAKAGLTPGESAGLAIGLLILFALLGIGALAYFGGGVASILPKRASGYFFKRKALTAATVVELPQIHSTELSTTGEDASSVVIVANPVNL